MSRNKPFNPKTVAAPLGAYVHGMEVPEGARLTFVSGQVGVDREGNLPADFRAQADNAWANCRAMLDHNGLSLGDVVKVTHYLTRREDLAAYREVRQKYLPEEPPCSALLIVAGLVGPDYLVEVEMVAAKIPH